MLHVQFVFCHIAVAKRSVGYWRCVCHCRSIVRAGQL